jgi:hypothetical protein
MIDCNRCNCRWILGPLYYVSVVLFISELKLSRGPIWIIGFILAIFLTLAPTPLFELRYFNQGLVLASLHVTQLPVRDNVGMMWYLYACITVVL